MAANVLAYYMKGENRVKSRHTARGQASGLKAGAVDEVRRQVSERRTSSAPKGLMHAVSPSP